MCVSCATTTRHPLFVSGALSWSIGRCPCFVSLLSQALVDHEARYPRSLVGVVSGRVMLFLNAPGMGRFQLLNLGVLGYGLELRFWVVIAIIVSLTLTLITTLTII